MRRATAVPASSIPKRPVERAVTIRPRAARQLYHGRRAASRLHVVRLVPRVTFASRRGRLCVHLGGALAGCFLADKHADDRVALAQRPRRILPLAGLEQHPDLGRWRASGPLVPFLLFVLIGRGQDGLNLRADTGGGAPPALQLADAFGLHDAGYVSRFWPASHHGKRGMISVARARTPAVASPPIRTRMARRSCAWSACRSPMACACFSVPNE